MMKSVKILSLILALIMLLSVALAGCAKDEGKKQGGGQVVVKTDEESSQCTISGR